MGNPGNPPFPRRPKAQPLRPADRYASERSCFTWVSRRFVEGSEGVAAGAGVHGQDQASLQSSGHSTL